MKKKKYKKMWVLLREQMTRQEIDAVEYSTKKETLHDVLVLMADMEAAEFLED